jgi:hypothetical protein
VNNSAKTVISQGLTSGHEEHLNNDCKVHGQITPRSIQKMRRLFDWILNYRLSAVFDWLNKNPHVIETAYDRRMEEALAAVGGKRACGSTRVVCRDPSGRETGSFEVHTLSVLEHLDKERRRTANGRFIWELEVFYQWLYRHTPGIGVEDASSKFSSHIAQRIPESDGKIRIYSPVCLACRKERPEFTITFAKSHSFNLAHSGVISCECRQVIFEHKSFFHFTVAATTARD